MGSFVAACDNFGLVINMEKTVVAPQINVSGTQLQAVDNFTFLGSTLSRNTKIDGEVTRHISKASRTFGRLQRSVWNHRGLHLNTELKMYEGVIQPTVHRRLLQQRLREIQEPWMARKDEEIQGYADRNEWKSFFAAIKAGYGPTAKGTAVLLSANGTTLLTMETQILKRWDEHFRGVLNRPSTIFDTAIARLPQMETNTDFDLPSSLH
nr:unnamed protein product [Spirometra erinaceieuropaei]